MRAEAERQRKILRAELDAARAAETAKRDARLIYDWTRRSVKLRQMFERREQKPPWCVHGSRPASAVPPPVVRAAQRQRSVMKHRLLPLRMAFEVLASGIVATIFLCFVQNCFCICTC